MTFEFYLGTHVLPHIDRTDVPLFVSYRQLRARKKKRFKQRGSVCVDSGGFSELSLYGEWTISPEEYVEGLERLQGLGLEITWAAQQDMMCEPIMLEKTGLTVREHQRRTVENLQTLRSFDSSIHFIPVLQGQTLEDYFTHFEMFEVAGFDLRKEPIVGVGSVCRRQSSNEIAHIMKCLHAKGLKLHGFGVKTDGLKKYGEYLKSSDSLAWSYGARYKPPCEPCASRNVKNCANCLDYALKWRKKVIA
jgi:hypothetical protein